jgi:hypothetical protein
VAKQKEGTQRGEEERDTPQEGQVWGEVEVGDQPVEGEGVNEGGEDLTGDQPETDSEHEGEESTVQQCQVVERVRRGGEIRKVMAGADRVGGEEERGRRRGIPWTGGEGEDLLSPIVRIDSKRGCQQQLIEESEGEEEHTGPSSGQSPKEPPTTEFLPEEVGGGLGDGRGDEVKGGGSVNDHYLVRDLSEDIDTVGIALTTSVEV